MTRLILSTSNILRGGPSIAQLATQEKSNVEFVTSLRANLLGVQEDVRADLSRAQNGHYGSSTPDQPNGHHHDPEKQLTNGAAATKAKKAVPLSSWTLKDPHTDTLYIPEPSLSAHPLEEEPDSYTTTVKIFYLPSLPSTSRVAATSEALKLVLDGLKTPSVDLLILSFPAISFDDDDAQPVVDCYGLRVVNGAASSAPIPEEMDRILDAWRILEGFVDRGLVKRIGVAEFGQSRLKELIGKARIKPAVNQVNLRDCCEVPQGLVAYAKSEGVVLYTHNDCTDILPEGTIRDLLGPGEEGAGVLAARNEKGLEEGEGLRGEVTPQWVVKYTSVVTNRGVVENKGYFAMAKLHER